MSDPDDTADPNTNPVPADEPAFITDEKSDDDNNATKDATKDATADAGEPSKQQHHNPSTEEDTASGGAAD